MFHCWVVFEHFLPEAKHALTQVKAWAMSTLGSVESINVQAAHLLPTKPLLQPEPEPESELELEPESEVELNMDLLPDATPT